MGPDAIILIFWMLSSKPTFSLSSFTFNSRLFSISSHSVIRVVSSAYQRLLIFLPAVLIPACASSSPTFPMMYSTCKLQYTALTYSFSYLESVCCSMSSSNCCFLTYIQVSQEAGQVTTWYSHLLKNFPQFIVIHTVKGFGIVNKAEIDVFLKLSYFFDDPADVGNLISSSSAFCKTCSNIWKFTVYILLKLGWRILSITWLACEMSAIVQ